MTVRDLFLWGREELARALCPDPETDARLLLYYAADADLTWYALHGGDPAEESVQESYKEAVERRALREPLQYITGTAPRRMSLFRGSTPRPLWRQCSGS